MTRPVTVIWQWNRESINEFDWVRRLFSQIEHEEIEDWRHEVVLDRAVVVVGGSKPGRPTVAQYLQRFVDERLRFGVIDLGDEFDEHALSYYPHAAFVWRNYYRPAAMRFANCRYFGIGYKNGLPDHVVERPVADRRYAWSFAGQLKRSRCRMLAEAEKIPGGRSFLTQDFHDPDALSTAAYAELLCDSRFVLCPRGNKSVDCFRVYEALECGAIPIVEDDGGAGLWWDTLTRGFRPETWRPRSIARELRRHARGGYWRRAYGEDVPLPLLHHWDRLRPTIEKIDPQATAEALQTWWRAYKASLPRRFADDCQAAFDDAARPVVAA